MNSHPAVDSVIKRIKKDQIGGAVDTAREVMGAMMRLVEDSQVVSTIDLYKEMDLAAYAILRICPSFAPPINVLHMIMRTIEDALERNSSISDAKQNLFETKNKFEQFLNDALGKIAQIGSELINDGDRVFMFSMTSSVWRILRKAKECGKRFTVLVTLASPANEGWLTVDEMIKSNIPVEISIDACIAELIRSSDIAFAGVDAVGSDGSVFNKSGTYLVALAARECGVPFYFVSDTLKFDTATLSGLPYRNEPIQSHEILEGNRSSSDVKVIGNLFDATPPHLVRAIITELGPIHPSSCINVMWNMKLSKRISELLPSWANGKL